MNKIDYIGLVSHELKTPIASITGYADIIRNGMVDEDTVKRFADKIYRESNRMGKLVDDLAYLIKYYEEDMVPQLYEKGVYRIAVNAAERIQVLYNYRGRIDINIRGNAKAMLDEFMLEEAIFKIFDNAVLYGNNEYKMNETEEDMSYVTIDVDIKKVEGKVFISIADRGVGINEDEMEKVFDVFYRVNKKDSRMIGCNGLGLPVVKAITTIHAGDCRIERNQYGGTTVSMYI